MTLRRQMAYQIGAMILGLLLISLASLWGIHALQQDVDTVVAGYQDLRQLYEASSHVAVAQAVLSQERPDGRQAMRQIQMAAGRLELDPPVSSVRQRELLDAIRAGLVEAQGMLWAEVRGEAGANGAELRRELSRVMKHFSDLATEIRRGVEEAQTTSERKRRTTLGLVGGLSAVVVAGAIAIGTWHYQTVMRPLRRLGIGVGQVAEGRLGERVAPAGPEEFAGLARDFNQMAAELEGLYKDLEQKVVEKSRQLVRSERLASVGYLAAGVAHEINNPIGIIAGYAELSAQKLRGRADDSALTEAVRGLEIIGEEAFRCKEIVQRLLTLARPGEEHREPVSLSAVAADVVSLVKGLKEFGGRRVELDVAQGERAVVLASEGEMKQVVLNLTLNALEAVENGGGVRLEVKRDGGWVELSVMDDGRGMTSEVLERVFEPFFTAKRGAGRPGTGLGLSISHAIVEGHGGEISAHSEGLGRGSRFVVRLPAAPGEAS